MSEELCRRLRELSASRHDDLSVGDEAATLIEQQAARIAELECEVTRARSLSDTEIELLRRAEAAEAEVKRLREVLRKIELKDTKIQYGGNIYDAAGGIIDTVETEEFFGPCARLAREALAIQEPRRD